jgi:hypothetical protein
MTYFDRDRGVEGATKQAEAPATEDLGKCPHCKRQRAKQEKGPPVCPHGCETTGSSPPLSW